MNPRLKCVRSGLIFTLHCALFRYRGRGKNVNPCISSSGNGLWGWITRALVAGSTPQVTLSSATVLKSTTPLPPTGIINNINSCLSRASSGTCSCSLQTSCLEDTARPLRRLWRTIRFGSYRQPPRSRRRRDGETQSQYHPRLGGGGGSTGWLCIRQRRANTANRLQQCIWKYKLKRLLVFQKATEGHSQDVTSMLPTVHIGVR